MEEFGGDGTREFEGDVGFLVSLGIFLRGSGRAGRIEVELAGARIGALIWTTRIPGWRVIMLKYCKLDRKFKEGLLGLALGAWTE